MTKDAKIIMLEAQVHEYKRMLAEQKEDKEKIELNKKLTELNSFVLSTLPKLSDMEFMQYKKLEIITIGK